MKSAGMQSDDKSKSCNLRGGGCSRTQPRTYSWRELGGSRTPPSWSLPPPSERSWSWPRSPGAWRWKSLPSFHLTRTGLERTRHGEIRRTRQERGRWDERNREQSGREKSQKGSQRDPVFYFVV